MHTAGTASGYLDLLNKLNAFLTDTGSVFGVRRFGVGSGRLTNYRGGAVSVAESFTLTAESATSFSVVGSTSGRIGTATVAEPFNHARLAFTIAAGGTAFAPGDRFELMTAPRWVAMRSVASSEYIWKAPGAGGTSAIYVGARAVADAGSDIYNLRLNGFTGYDAAATFDGQPGAIAQTPPELAAWQGALPYWFVANGRRVIVLLKVSTVFHAAYLGLIEQYVSPTAFPYALAVGGSVAGTLRYSDTSSKSSCFPMASAEASHGRGTLRLRLPTGEWRGFNARIAGALASDATVWPYDSGMTALRPNLDGTYPLLPVILSDATPNIYGQLDGVWATTGFGSGAESIIEQGHASHLVGQNLSNTATNQYFTVELD